MRPSTRELLQEIAARYGVEPADLIAHRYGKRLLSARIEIAKALDARGYNGPQIAAVLRRDYTTVYFYLGRTRRPPKWLRPPELNVAKPKPKPKPPRTSGPRLIRYAGFDPREILR
jgi:hypothetical protein